jgi:hypothetical protein
MINSKNKVNDINSSTSVLFVRFFLWDPKLQETSKGENTVKWIKGQRISWLGHLERMEEDRGDPAKDGKRK